MKTIGVVPARMAASRFPGKPLHPICGRPMLEHCFERSKLFAGWDGLFLATCDIEIKQFAEAKGYPVLMTAATHTRALDRVAEAAANCGLSLDDDDVVVCVQGDEPLLGPDVIEAVLKPFSDDPTVKGTMLAVPIQDEETFLNPDIVKIVSDMAGDVLYTSRAPVPYAKGGFSKDLGAMRVGGIFGFRWHFLRWFTETPESPLEIKESCDSNRICDNGFRQRIAPIPYRPYVSVDSPSDVARVEAVMKQDVWWGRY
ncbi:3-deoxy-manno-octulosonate cytidylyltransferase [Magnetospira thiophila]